MEFFLFKVLIFLFIYFPSCLIEEEILLVTFVAADRGILDEVVLQSMFLWCVDLTRDVN